MLALFVMYSVSTTGLETPKVQVIQILSRKTPANVQAPKKVLGRWMDVVGLRSGGGELPGAERRGIHAFCLSILRLWFENSR